MKKCIRHGNDFDSGHSLGPRPTNPFQSNISPNQSNECKVSFMSRRLSKCMQAKVSFTQQTLGLVVRATGPLHCSHIRHHNYSQTPRTMADTTTTTPQPELKDQIQLAENQDAPAVLNMLQKLITGTPPHKPWSICLNGAGIQRSFHFKTFRQTWEFMDAVAEECKRKRHHPEWWNVRIHAGLVSSFYFLYLYIIIVL